MQGLTFSLNKNWKKNPKVLSDQVVFLPEKVVYVCKSLEQVGCLETLAVPLQPLNSPCCSSSCPVGGGVGTEFSAWTLVKVSQQPWGFIGVAIRALYRHHESMSSFSQIHSLLNGTWN